MDFVAAAAVDKTSPNIRQMKKKKKKKKKKIKIKK